MQHLDGSRTAVCLLGLLRHHSVHTQGKDASLDGRHGGFVGGICLQKGERAAVDTAWTVVLLWSHILPLVCVKTATPSAHLWWGWHRPVPRRHGAGWSGCRQAPPCSDSRSCRSSPADCTAAPPSADYRQRCTRPEQRTETNEGEIKIKRYIRNWTAVKRD